MQLFRVTSNNQLEPVEAATAARAGLTETGHLEAWIRTQESIFDRENILWLSRQERITADERADLLGLCGAEVILCELKRGLVPKEAVAQGLSYLARHAKSDRLSLRELFIAQAGKTGEWALRIPPIDADEAEDEFDQHAVEGVQVNSFRSLLLVGEDFDPETLQVCNLLNESLGLNGLLTLECWRLHIFVHKDEHLCAFDKLLPSKDVEEEIAQRRADRSAGKGKRDRERITVMKRFKDLCRSNGLKPVSNQGQSYRCELKLGDNASAWFTVSRGDPDSLVWVPVNGGNVDLAYFQNLPGSQRSADDPQHWTVPVRCANWKNAEELERTANEAAAITATALRCQPPAV